MAFLELRSFSIRDTIMAYVWIHQDGGLVFACIFDCQRGGRDTSSQVLSENFMAQPVLVRSSRWKTNQQVIQCCSLYNDGNMSC